MKFPQCFEGLNRDRNPPVMEMGYDGLIRDKAVMH